MKDAINEVRDELTRINSSLDELNDVVPTLRSEVDEKVQAALTEAKEANSEALALEYRLLKANKKLTLKIATPIIVLILFAAANFYSLYETRQSADKIKDCIEPTGECFQGNRSTLGPLIEDVVQGVNDSTAREAERAINEMKTLFCQALDNAELSVPPACEPLLDEQVVVPPPGE